MPFFQMDTIHEDNEGARPALTLVLGIAFGAFIWWASPLLSGQAEPWDHSVWQYSLALAIAGALAAAAAPKYFWLAPPGIFIG